MAQLRTLTEPEWRPLEAAHQARVAELTAAHLERRRRGERHAVEDFLFDYYGFSPARLARWHPGPGVALLGAGGEPRAGWTHLTTTPEGALMLDVPAYLQARGKAVAFVRRLLERTLERDVHTGCFGLHEWAMVYRQPQERRHGSLPLRLGGAGTDAVLEASTLRCTHFDATRFFTPEGLARNTLSPARDTMDAFEQPGCLHAGMDVYRWAYKLAPAVPSELVADAFVLAREIRTLDMQASPYDLRALGYEPVRIETPDGRREYAERQRAFAERSNALRRRLLETIDALGGAATDRSRQTVTTA
ncbi:MAG: hypothetical protein PGN13_00210 [Patulibacter minatonensis]